MKSIILLFKSPEKQLIPFEHNYYTGIAIQQKYNRLLYNEKIEKHSRIQSNYTISSIIPKKPEINKNGIYTDRFFIVLRSIDDNFIKYIKAAFAIYPEFRINNSIFNIYKIEDTEKIKFKDNTKFKAISPFLIRYKNIHKNFVTKKENIPENMKAWIIDTYKKFTGLEIKEDFDIKIDNVKVKSIMASNNVRLRGVLLSGEFINLKSDVQELFYYKGIGSKTGLGLGCWGVLP